MNDIIVNFTKENDCFATGRTMNIKGIMIHSTATPGVMALKFRNAFNKAGLNKAVHAFVDDDGVVQCLPWTMRAWHCGTGTSGKSGNDGYISIEICEPSGYTYKGGYPQGYDAEANKEYFENAYNNAVELCKYLCKEYNIIAENIICHCEAYKMGIASDHSDVMQWFPLHGKDMNMFRNDVKGVKNIMRYFKLLEEMNMRTAPNGAKVGIVPADTVICGTDLVSVNNVQWLKTEYNGNDGFVAVLPESRKYAVEIEPIENDSNDYETLYLEEKGRADKLNSIIEKIKEILA